MSDARSLLYSRHGGKRGGAPFLVLHDRFGGLEEAETLGERLGDDVLRIAVRAPRLQVSGGGAKVLGHFWFIGPPERPELSTLGDGLYQLELLLLDTFAAQGQRKVGLYGVGEGAVVALLLALVRPEKLSAVIIEDAVLPLNIDAMPIDAQPLAGLPVLLLGGDAAVAESLRTRGAVVTLVDRSEVAAIARFAAGEAAAA